MGTMDFTSNQAQQQQNQNLCQQGLINQSLSQYYMLNSFYDYNFNNTVFVEPVKAVKKALKDLTNLEWLDLRIDEMRVAL